jgi:hypothetical protein
MAKRAACLCSVLPLTPRGYSLRTTPRSHCAHSQEWSGRPESIRDLRDALIVSLCADVVSCTTRAKALEPAGSRSITEVTHAPRWLTTGTATGSAEGNEQTHEDKSDRAAAPRSGLAFCGVEERHLTRLITSEIAGSNPAPATASITPETRGKAPAFERCAVAGENSGRPGRLGIGPELGVPTDDGGPAFPTVAGAAAHQSEAA